jgi:hypothetical protein
LEVFGRVLAGLARGGRLLFGLIVFGFFSHRDCLCLLW